MPYHIFMPPPPRRRPLFPLSVGHDYREIVLLAASCVYVAARNVLRAAFCIYNFLKALYQVCTACFLYAYLVYGTWSLVLCNNMRLLN